MTARRLPSGSGFVNRMLALSAMLSLPALLLLLPTLAAIFRLTSEQWSYLSIFALGFAALGTLAMLHVQRRLATPIATWLDERDAGEASEERTGEAFRALMALPVRVGLLSFSGEVDPV